MNPTQQDAAQGTGLPAMIAVSSGKGGVGKSTVTVNLALALRETGLRVGIVDADLYGPSIPGMLGLLDTGTPAMSPANKVIPAEAHGIKVISMGMLTSDDKPAVMRGPMVTKYLQMFITQVDWAGIDLLLLDLPPGTGDIQLTLAQAFPLNGAVVVTTPQDVSLRIVRRGLRMMEQVNVPIIGVVENMSGFTCPCCGTVTDIFRQGGGARIAQALAVPFLGSVPLDPEVVESGDTGRPAILSAPHGKAAQAYRDVASALAGRVSGDKRGLRTPFDWQVAKGTGQPAPGAVDPAGNPELPVAMRYDDATLRIIWEDGVEMALNPRDLRLACQCAACRDEMSGARLLDPATVPLDVVPTRIWNVGNYGIGVAFTDGHSSGIYTFKALRAMDAADLEDV